MDIDKSPSGKVILTPNEYNAFIPNKLPPHIEWDNRLAISLSRADFTLGKLAKEGSRLPNPKILMRPFITREAVLSSKIEGTQSTIGEILAYNAGAAVKQNHDDLQEVQNYILALDYGIDRLNSLPLSLRLIREVHGKLMSGVRGEHAKPGEFRKSQNWIGPAGCTLNTAKFVPPPVDCLDECLADFEKFMYNNTLPPLINVALCHYQFEVIHPFLDGNGRIGRLLIILLLISQKILPGPLLYLSPFFEATRDDYYRLLFNTSKYGVWNDWLIYFLNGVTLQSEDVLSRAERINQLLLDWKLQVSGEASKIPLLIVEHFAINPYLTIKKIAEDLGVAFSTVQRGINKLLDKKIVQPVNEKSRDRVFCATEVLSILEEPAKIKVSFESGEN